MFAVERFVEAEHLRKRTFEIPADFQIDEVLHGAFGVHVGDPDSARRVVVEFSAEKANLSPLASGIRRSNSRAQGAGGCA